MSPVRMRTLGPIAALLAGTLSMACGGDGPVGPAGPAGPEGPQGPPGGGQTPSISAISPVNVYLEHEDTVFVSGSATQWGTSMELDLGPGVSVNQLTVASPTSLVALVRADSTASLGTRTVTVRSSADTTTFENAFRVDAPLAFDFTGSFIPGGRVTGDVVLNNLEQPFPYLAPGAAFRTYLAETGTPGLLGLSSTEEAALTYLLPLNAPPGPTHFVIEEVVGETKWRTAGTDLPAPTVQPGPYGGSVTDAVSEAGASVVYSVDAQAGQMVAVTVSSPSGGFSTSLILPDSTHESVGQTFYAFDEATWFTTVYEFLGSAGPPFDYTFRIDTLTVTPPTLTASPTQGALSGLYLTDVYQIDGQVGEQITVTLSDGATDTCATIDAIVFVRAPSGRAILSELVGCGSVVTGPLEMTGAHSVFVAPNPMCACSFDYAVAATKS